MNITKITTLIFVFFVISFISLGTAYAGEIKIGYIDLSKTFDEYEKTKEFDKALEKKGDTKEGERKKLVDEIKELKDQIALLSNKSKDEKQAVIDDKIKKLQEFDQQARDELKQERDEMVRDIVREIDKVIQDYGKKQSYTAILNDRVLVYGDETIDITQDIIEILNKSYKKK